jgi:phage recombination protein Bet
MEEGNELVPTMGLKQEIIVTPEQVTLIKNTVAKGATDDELKLFVYNCQRLGTHPLDRLIHFVKRKGADGAQATHQCSIDYFRSLAEESGEYNGQDEPEFEYDEKKEYPALARVKVYKKGIDRPIVGVAHWKEYCPPEKLAFMWRKMPTHMLAKCAEALALRKAFPKKLAGLYTPEEMARPDDASTLPPPKVDSVKPAPSASGAQPVETAPKEERDVKAVLKEELKEYCKGDAATGFQVLKEISAFGTGKDEKWIKDIDKASDKWCGRALGNLRDRANSEKG